jgi:ribokinase
VTEPPSKVCVLGSVNVDTTYRVPQIPALGETVLAVQRTVAPGGKGANQAVAAATMGSRVAFIGCTGSDPEAELAIASLVRHGVDVSQLRAVTDAPTGTAVLVVDERGENVIVVDAGANQRLDPALVSAHLSSTSYDVVLAQLEINLNAVVSAAMSRGSAAFILNPAPMNADHGTFRDLLAHTDVLVPNRPELARLAGRPLPADQDELDRCVAQLEFGGVVVVTLGSAGVAVYERGPARRPTLIDAVRVESVDTTGAGDTFCGVLGHFMAQHGDVTRAARQANEMAALSTTVYGAQVPAGLFTSSGPRPVSAAPDRLT